MKIFSTVVFAWCSATMVFCYMNGQPRWALANAFCAGVNLGILIIRYAEEGRDAE